MQSLLIGQGQVERPALLAQRSQLRPKGVGLSDKMHSRMSFALLIHAAQDTVAAVQIQGCVKRSVFFHRVQFALEQHALVACALRPIETPINDDSANRWPLRVPDFDDFHIQPAATRALASGR